MSTPRIKLPPAYLVVSASALPQRQANRRRALALAAGMATTRPGEVISVYKLVDSLCTTDPTKQP